MIAQSPIQELKDFSPDHQVFIKREDLIHPEYGGNKYRKLKYNLDRFQKNEHDVLITYGGAFSNHIAATASICRDYKIPSLGIIRGEVLDHTNPTLLKAQKDGMQLIHVPKVEYSLKSHSSLISNIIKEYDNPLLIPEGGSNQHALLGVEDMMDEIDSQFDELFVSAGTGTTARGIINRSGSSLKVNIINALKNPSLTNVIKENSTNQHFKWEVYDNYHCGGFAKTTKEQQVYAQKFYDTYGIFLDPVYNSKTVLAVRKEIDLGKLQKGKKILIIHTGGHQGITAYEYVKRSRWINS